MGEAETGQGAPVIDIRTRQHITDMTPDTAALDTAGQWKEADRQLRTTINGLATEGIVASFVGIGGGKDVDDTAADVHGRARSTLGCALSVPDTGGVLLLTKSKDHPAIVILPEADGTAQRLQSAFAPGQTSDIGASSIDRVIEDYTQGFRHLREGDEGFAEAVAGASTWLEGRRQEQAKQTAGIQRVVTSIQPPRPPAGTIEEV